MSDKLAVYPGTFDPFTFGHLDIVRRSSKLFDRIIISVAENNSKSALFNLDERIEIVSNVISNEKDLDKIEIKGFSGLLVDHVVDIGAVAVLRGLRALSDFEYEFQMAGINARLSNEFETIFLMASENQQFVASRFVKEIHSLGGDVSSFVPKIVMEHLEKKKK
jgi:pantetheine-phosphate adenylyltransferase|tara:strand:- start:116 stop:607 length:492 start_codon:yes stop_codon:yes gene_type:complete